MPAAGRAATSPGADAVAPLDANVCSSRGASALAGRSACLLANHGMLVLGREIDQALALAIEFETLCEHYLRACQLGPPVILDAAEMQRVIERFAAND